MIVVLAWALTAGAVAAVLRATVGATPLLRMTAVIVVLFAGMKAVVAAEWMRQTGGRLSAPRWLAFGLWPGMRPSDFVTRRDGARAIEVAPGWWCLGLGAALLFLARTVVRHSPLAALVLALPALSLVLHFGILRLAAAFWRARGFEVAVPFDAPHRATSLGEFWSRRWNRPFSDMTALVIYRPIARACGAGPALAAAFFFSGVVHELAISVPAGAGYGGPLAYFLFHGLLVGAERRRPAWKGRLWTAASLVLPLPLLFHRPFLEGVVLPLLR